MRPLILALLLLLPTAIPAQGKQKEPKRPKLAAGRDTNTAWAYYDHGLGLVGKDDEGASAAFYWASRIDPAWAEPLYARRVAIMLSDHRRFTDWLARKKHARESKEMRAADSLLNEALLRDPLLVRRLDKQMLEHWFEREFGVHASAIDWGREDPSMGGWIAFSRTDFPKAIELFTKSIKRGKDRIGDYNLRALSYYQMGRRDSAVADMQAMIEELRKRDRKDLVFFYESKAHAEYTIGRIHADGDDLDKAKEAFGRALAEDLSFYMAHAALADVAHALGDTATALQEYGLAIELKPTDPALRVRYGNVLVSARKYDEAAEQYAKSIELEPWYAPPYFVLGYIRENQGKHVEALAAYQGFVARAPRAMADRIAHAKESIESLKPFVAKQP